MGELLLGVGEPGVLRGECTVPAHAERHEDVEKDEEGESLFQVREGRRQRVRDHVRRYAGLDERAAARLCPAARHLLEE
ncbi:hypothetical protein [Streptomyces sp. WAC 00631]|uniref:hypothetical protein n=1 Tax=Streptomyces sp. WAC 00631 TaxID=2203201 RepID=UPI00163B769C|nr:hypothetical protein [Streptomyces sp. WAC 00631]